MENQTKPTDLQQAEEDEISLLELLLILARHNRLILKVTGAAAILAVIVSLLMTNIYTGKTVILPPQQSSSSASMLLGQLGGLAGAAGAAGGSLGIKNPSDLYVGMLNSRTVADALIRRFKLQDLYKTDTLTSARRILGNATSIVSGKDGFITVEFDDKDPKLAAAIANAYIEELDNLSQSLAVTEAAQRRLFFEKQLETVRKDLAAAEVAFKEMQEKTGLIQLDGQSGAVIAAVATLRAQVAAKEVELAAMRAYATEQNPDYRQGREVIAGLKAQLAKLERDNVNGQGDVLIPTGKVPEAGLEYARRMRDVKYQETLFELLVKQLEAAKIDEARDSAIIQVVDKALPPEYKSKPRRSLIVILTALAAFFLAVLWAFVKEANEKARKNPEQAERLNLIRRYLRGK